MPTKLSSLSVHDTTRAKPANSWAKTLPVACWMVAMALLPVMSWLLLLAFASLSRSYTLPAGAAVTPKPIRPAIRGRDGTGLDKRDITTVLSTCGYLDGDPNQPRTANSGFNCLVDTQNGLWGFCTTTALVATDCAMAGSCQDSHGCSDGCGLTDRQDLSRITWLVFSFLFRAHEDFRARERESIY